MPPNASYLRMTWEAAGVDRMPPCPTRTLAKAVGSRHADGDLDDVPVEDSGRRRRPPGLARKPFQAVEDRLDEIFDIVGLLENRHLLAQA